MTTFEEIIRKFYSKKFSNMELFDLIEENGCEDFFIRLHDYLTFERTSKEIYNAYSPYIDISKSYFIIKKYFLEH